MPNSRIPAASVVSNMDVSDDYDDMILMPKLTSESILGNVRRRYERDVIYTAVSSIVIAVNPYQSIPQLYDQTAIIRYHSSSSAESLPPHIYSIARACYDAAMGYNNNTAIGPQSQSILISGESGAGKTETTKHILNYLTSVSTSHRQHDRIPSNDVSSFNAAVDSVISHNIEHKLLQANPILEAFGNAKTLRNDNSSRFGKWINLILDSDKGAIIGGRIDHYLLESSRVVKQAEGERNYNIFYQLCQQRHIDPQRFHYLNHSGCISITGIDDAQLYHTVINAMKALGFTDTQHSQVMDLVLGILYLGNIDFKAVQIPGGKEGCEISPSCMQSLSEASRLLGFPLQMLKHALTTRVIVSPRSTIINMPRSVKEAQDNRDSIAKTLYSCMVSWVIAKINQSICLSSFASFPSSSRTVDIGILDIFGFECFPVNSFEQLCINFANEKLHQHFLSYVFKQEVSVYREEGLTSLSNISFTDNQSTIELLEKKPNGIFSLLTEEVNLPKGSDQNLLPKLHTAHHNHPAYSHPKVQGLPVFSLAHYAHTVEYSVTGMCDKNKKKMNEQTRGLLESSQMRLMRDIMRMDKQGKLTEAQDDEDDTDKNAATVAESKLISINNPNTNAYRSLPGSQQASRRASISGPITLSSSTSSASSPRSASTVTAAFQQSLTDLLASISLTHSHFVRCVKPNNQKQAKEIDEELMKRQLQSSGVIDAVSVRKQGYSERMKITEFVQRYNIMREQTTSNQKQSKQEKYKATVDDRSCVAAIMIHVLGNTAMPENLPALWQLGHTRVFYRHPVHLALEREYSSCCASAAVLIQKHVRGWLCRKKMKILMNHWTALRAALIEGKLDKVELALTAASSLLPPALLQRCQQQRSQLKSGEAAQHSLIQGLTMSSASLQDRIRLLTAGIAVAQSVPAAVYPTWYPSLSKLLEVAQSIHNTLKTSLATLSLIVERAPEDGQVKEQIQIWLQKAIKDTSDASRAMKHLKLDCSVICQLSASSEVISSQETANRYHKLHDSLNSALKARSKPALAAALQEANCIRMHWPIVAAARAHYEALSLMDEVDKAIESWQEEHLISTIDKLSTVVTNPASLSAVNACLPNKLTVQSLLDTTEANLVACRNEHEAKDTARKTLKQHSQDKRKLMFALQLAEDALYMTHHSRRSTLGAQIEISKHQATAAPTTAAASSDDGGLPALVTVLKAQCNRLDILAAKATQQEMKAEKAITAIKETQTESATEAQLQNAIQLAQEAGLPADIISQAQTHLLTVQTTTLLTTAINARTLSALIDAVNISKERLKKKQLDVRTYAFNDRYETAKGLIQMLQQVSSLNELIHVRVRPMTVERDNRRRQRSSLPQPIADPVTVEQVKKEEAGWQSVINELKQGILAARLKGAKDVDMKEAIELAHNIEESHFQNDADIDNSASLTTFSTPLKASSLATVETPSSAVVSKKTDAKTRVNVAAVRVFPATPSRPASSINKVLETQSPALRTPLSVDDKAAQSTAAKIIQTHANELEARRRIQMELIDQEHTMEQVKRQSVAVPGGPIVSYDNITSRTHPKGSSPQIAPVIALSASAVSNPVAAPRLSASISSAAPSHSMSISGVGEPHLSHLVRVSQEHWTFNVQDLEHPNSVIHNEPNNHQIEKAVIETESKKQGERAAEATKAQKQSGCCCCVIS